MEEEGTFMGVVRDGMVGNKESLSDVVLRGLRRPDESLRDKILENR